MFVAIACLTVKLQTTRKALTRSLMCDAARSKFLNSMSVEFEEQQNFALNSAHQVVKIVSGCQNNTAVFNTFLACQNEQTGNAMQQN